MNLLLTIQYTNYLSRIIVPDTDSVLSKLESSNNRIPMCLCKNIAALNKIKQIMSGDAKPYVTFLAGNSYFGKVTFKYTRPDKNHSPAHIYKLTVKVFSALGSTIEEHDERYKRLKAARLPDNTNQINCS